MLEPTDNHNDDELKELLARFEDMVRKDTFVFFDADDFDILIEHYFQTQNAEMLKPAIEGARVQYPSNPSFRISEAQFLASQQKLNEALSILDELETLNPDDSDLFMTRGYIYSQMGESDKAIENFKQALRVSENKEDVYTSLGSEFINQNDFENALIYLKKGFELNPENEMKIGRAHV